MVVKLYESILRCDMTLKQVRAFISQKVFRKSFSKSQFPHKSVDLSIMLVIA